MADYFRDLIARQNGTAEVAEPVLSHPFTGDTPAAAAVHMDTRRLIDAETMPEKLARNLGIIAPTN